VAHEVHAELTAAVLAWQRAEHPLLLAPAPQIGAACLLLLPSCPLLALQVQQQLMLLMMMPQAGWLRDPPAVLRCSAPAG
jgi:hypothetical protein